MEFNARDLDNHITGHYGEEQFEQDDLTPSQAKKIIKFELDRRELPYTKLTAKTISFSDLARADCIFVKIHGWQPNPIWDELKATAIARGFRIE